MGYQVTSKISPLAPSPLHHRLQYFSLALCVQYNSPLEFLLSDLLTLLNERGVVQYLENRYMPYRHLNEDYLIGDKTEEPLVLENFYYPLLVYVCGLAVTALAFLMEGLFGTQEEAEEEEEEEEAEDAADANWF